MTRHSSRVQRTPHRLATCSEIDARRDTGSHGRCSRLDSRGGSPRRRTARILLGVARYPEASRRVGGMRPPGSAGRWRHDDRTLRASPGGGVAAIVDVIPRTCVADAARTSQSHEHASRTPRHRAAGDRSAGRARDRGAAALGPRGAACSTSSSPRRSTSSPGSASPSATTACSRTAASVAVRWLKILLASTGSMAVEGSVVGWVATHRRHHVFSDKPGDPHSPHEYGPGVGGAAPRVRARARRLVVQGRPHLGRSGTRPISSPTPTP